MSTTKDDSALLVENHVLSLDYLDVEVHVEQDGSVGIYFKQVDGPTLMLTPLDLGRVVAFAETHGQITIAPRED